MTSKIRVAKEGDIPGIQVVRRSVKKDALSNPFLIIYEDYVTYLHKRGKGWVCETDNKIVEFSIADLQDDNNRALFVLPESENKGIGKCLHQLMPDWYFTHQKEKVWLSTSPGTRAETYYIKQGWTKAGYLKTGEIKMEMTATVWLSKTYNSKPLSS